GRTTMSSTRISAVVAAMIVGAADVASAQPPQNQDAIPDTPGTGPFTPMKEIDPGLPDQVVYRPADLASLGDAKLGLYVFGNGACSNDGASARLHLLNIASHGYLSIAPGGIYNGPGKTEAPPRPDGASMETYAPTRPAQLSAAIDWALAENERSGSPYYRCYGSGRVADTGFSGGGVQALTSAGGPRVKTVVSMNGGVVIGGGTRMGGMRETKGRIEDLHTPSLYVLGGPTDIG